MRIAALHEDVLVLESRIWRTACTVVRSGEEALVIDSPVLPDEIEVIPSLLEQSGFPFSGLLATHADWDHLLGRLAFPGAPLGLAETSAARLRAEPGAAQRQLRDFDERHYVDRPAPLGLGGAEALPVPGYCALGERELELHPAEGHTTDGMAVWIPWARVLVCGDYLSPVEIPTVAAPDAYLATLTRLEPLLSAAEWIVAGHGGAVDSERAAALLAEDRAYVEALRAGGAVELPPSRRTAEQRRLHELNVQSRT